MKEKIYYLQYQKSGRWNFHERWRHSHFFSVTTDHPWYSHPLVICCWLALRHICEEYICIDPMHQYDDCEKRTYCAYGIPYIYLYTVTTIHISTINFRFYSNSNFTSTENGEIWSQSALPKNRIRAKKNRIERFIPLQSAPFDLLTVVRIRKEDARSNVGDLGR